MPGPIASLQRHGDSATVVVVGELDTSTVEPLYAAFDRFSDSSIRQVVIDLSEVTYLGSAGVSVLCFCRKMLDGRGPVVLRRPSPHIRKLLQLTGLTELFTLEPDTPTT